MAPTLFLFQCHQEDYRQAGPGPPGNQGPVSLSGGWGIGLAALLSSLLPSLPPTPLPGLGSSLQASPLQGGSLDSWASWPCSWGARPQGPVLAPGGGKAWSGTQF